MSPEKENKIKKIKNKKSKKRRGSPFLSAK